RWHGKGSNGNARPPPSAGPAAERVRTQNRCARAGEHLFQYTGRTGGVQSSGCPGVFLDITAGCSGDWQLSCGEIAMSAVPVVSVVVPTYQRPDLLERCLAALLKQGLSRDAYEIIVCDDGPSAAAQAVVQAANEPR